MFPDTFVAGAAHLNRYMANGKNKKLRNLATLMVFGLFVLGCAKKDDVTVVSNNVLNDLKPLVEVAEYLYTNATVDKPIVKKVEVMIYGKVISVKTLQPELTKLNGASLKGLCAVVAFSRNTNFGKSINDAQITQLVTNYLNSIEPILKAHTSELKKTVFTNSDCAI